jgi:diketogulonate reductase-like aldo/keto reductase
LSENFNRKVTPAQVLLRWSLQRNCALVLKTCSSNRMNENSDIFDFTLADEDMKVISIVMPSSECEGRLCWRTEPLRMLDFN